MTAKMTPHPALPVPHTWPGGLIGCFGLFFRSPFSTLGALPVQLRCHPVVSNFQPSSANQPAWRRADAVPAEPICSAVTWRCTGYHFPLPVRAVLPAYPEDTASPFVTSGRSRPPAAPHPPRAQPPIQVFFDIRIFSIVEQRQHHFEATPRRQYAGWDTVLILFWQITA